MTMRAPFQHPAPTTDADLIIRVTSNQGSFNKVASGTLTVQNQNGARMPFQSLTRYMRFKKLARRRSGADDRCKPGTRYND